MDRSLAVPHLDFLETQLRLDTALAAAVDKVLPFDLARAPTQHFFSDCCSSNDHLQRRA